MFGTYRTLLALLVVFHHLLSIPVIGHYAVHGFFILSGYLMTFIMHRSYGYSLNGLLAFSQNRFLRLFPTYWVILSISIIIIIFFGEENASAYREFMQLPASMFEWLQNLSMIYLSTFPSLVTPRISPPTWALTIEIAFYALIALGISKSKLSTTIWFVFSICYMAYTHITNLTYDYRYSYIISGTLPFSIGAMIYHYYTNFKSIITNEKLINYLIIAFIINCLISIWFNKINPELSILSFLFYLNYIINALIIFILIKGKFPWIPLHIDKKIGDYSYPLYLVHWQAGFAASMIIWDAPFRGYNVASMLTLIFALVISLAISFLTINYVDTPIEKIRKRIKYKNNKIIEQINL